MAVTDRREARRELRRSGRRRRRGGAGRGPRVLQHTAQRVSRSIEEGRHHARRVIRGDRPFVLVLVGVLVLAAVVLSGPTQSFVDGRSRVDALERKAAALEDANGDLRRRVDDLNDPLRIELIAREQQGFVRPGEVAYSITAPEVDRPRITAPRASTSATDDAPWHVRVRGIVEEWFGA